MLDPSYQSPSHCRGTQKLQEGAQRHEVKTPYGLSDWFGVKMIVMLGLVLQPDQCRHTGAIFFWWDITSDLQCNPAWFNRIYSRCTVAAAVIHHDIYIVASIFIPVGIHAEQRKSAKCQSRKVYKMRLLLNLWRARRSRCCGPKYGDNFSELVGKCSCCVVIFLFK